MNHYLEQAFNGSFDWEQWENDVRKTILNQNEYETKFFDRVFLIHLTDQLNTLIGFIWISRHLDNILWIDSFVILSEFRSKGYGSQVFKEIIKIAKNSPYKFKSIELGVQEENKKAIQFYKSLGFSEIPDLSMAYFNTMRLKFHIT